MLRRPDIDHILRAAAVITAHTRFVVVGTGAVIITARLIPAAMMLTAEIDLYADGVDDPEPISDLIDAAIGSTLGRPVLSPACAHITSSKDAGCDDPR